MNKGKDRLLDLLGDLPEPGPITAVLLKVEEHDGYQLESLLLDLNGIEPVPAYIAKPLQGDGPFPLVLYNHSHGGNYANGRNEFIRSSPYLQQPSFAKALTGMGVAACCIDMWGFYSYVPGLLKHYTTLQIQERIVPRPRMSLTGRNDRMCPAEGVRLLAEGLAEAYRKAGKPEHWQPVAAGGGHMETLEMRVAWQGFLAAYL